MLIYVTIISNIGCNYLFKSPPALLIISFQSQNQAENEKYWDIRLGPARRRMEGDGPILPAGAVNIPH